MTQKYHFKINKNIDNEQNICQDIEDIYGKTKDETMKRILHNFFYHHTKRTDILLDIISGKSQISLRVLDWFVTNYAKKNDTNYYLKDDGETILFSVYLEYKAQLKAYGKIRIDPFCRHQRINFEYKKGKYIETTIGQLNFFMWAIKNKIIDYVNLHYDEITKDMTETIKQNKMSEQSELSSEKKSPKYDLGNHTIKKKIMADEPSDEQQDSSEKKKHRKKRKELSISAAKTIRRHDMSITLKFE